MGWKQWSAVAVVIGGATMQGDVPADMADVEGTVRTVALDVTGMT